MKLHRNPALYFLRDYLAVTLRFDSTPNFPPRNLTAMGVRAGGARGAAAPPNFGQLRFFGQQEKIWAKPVFKDVSMFFFISLKRQIFSILN